jgi:hypothetical protein
MGRVGGWKWEYAGKFYEINELDGRTSGASSIMELPGWGERISEETRMYITSFF